MCKSHYVDCLIKELFSDNSLANPTYTSTTCTKEVNPGQSQVCCMFLWNFIQRLRTGSTVTLLDPKLNKFPCKQRYIAGSAKCSTKPLSKLLTCILSSVRTGFKSYYDTSYSWGGVNQMWILKNSNDLLKINTIQTPLILQ